MVTSDWWEVLYPVKGVLKCATTMSGGQSVTMDGVLLMLELLVDGLDFLQQVKSVFVVMRYRTVSCSLYMEHTRRHVAIRVQ